MLADGNTDYTYGAPLTSSELENMLARERLTTEADGLITYVIERPDQFGGFYFTQDTGRLEATALSTRSTPEASLKRMKSLIPADLPTTVRVVDYTSMELDRAASALVAKGESIGLRTVWPDTKNNRVSATIAPGSSASAVEKIAGQPVDVSFGEGLKSTACSNVNVCTPYRGGIHILYPPAPIHCTWGFYGTRGTAARYIITNGHCGRKGFTLQHNAVTFSNPADRNVYDEVTASNSDSMTAHVLGSPNAVSPFNLIFVSSTDKSHAITAVKSNSSQVVGVAVCFAGIASGARCGVIEATGVSGNITRFDGKTVFFVNLIQMSRIASSGDSGGPAYNGATAFGLTTAVNVSNNHMVYSRIGNVGSDMGINVCTSAAC